MLFPNTLVQPSVVRALPKPLTLNNTNRPIDLLTMWSKTRDLRMDAPYQRSVVWGVNRQANLIRSFIIGVPIPSLILNWRDWPGDYSIAVVDGKQRITTFLTFLNSELAVPGEWFGLHGDVIFSDLPIGTRRRFANKGIAVSEATLGSIEEEEEVFNLINYGGVPQGLTDTPA